MRVRFPPPAPRPTHASASVANRRTPRRGSAEERAAVLLDPEGAGRARGSRATNGDACDEARLGRGEKERRVRDLLDGPEAGDRTVLGPLAERLRTPGAQHQLRLDWPGRDCIDGDPVVGKIQRGRSGEPDDAGL